MKANLRKSPNGRRNLLAGMFLSLFALSATASLAAQGAGGIAWQNDLNRALGLAREHNRLIFLHFYGNNCPPCKAMETEVFPNPQVAAEMNKAFVAIKIDTGLNPALAKKFNITAIPTDIVLDGKGQVVHRRQGGIAPDRFVQYLGHLQEVAKSARSPQAAQAPPVVTAMPTPPVASSPVPAPAPAPVMAPASAPGGMAAPIATAAPTITEAPPVEMLQDPFTRQPAVVVVPSAEMSKAAPAATAEPVGAPAAVAVATPVVSPFAPVAPVVPVAEKPAMERENPVRGNGETALTSPPSPPAASPGEPAGAEVVEVPLALEGYCPVVLGNDERWMPGNPALYAMYRGQVYRFSSEEAMAAFHRTPLKYAPVAMGEDIVLMVQRNKKAYGARKFGAWYEGRVYLFSSQETLDAFAARPEYFADIARKYETAFKTAADTVQR